MRRSAALVLAVGLMVSLAACSGSATDEAAACTPTKAGKVSDAVKVSGKIGAKPKVTIAAPVSVTKTERTVAIKGDGKVAAEGNDVTVEYSIFNGTSGDAIDASTYDGTATVDFPLDGTLLKGLTKTLECSTVGSRVVGVIPPEDAFGETGNESAGVAAADSIVFVADVVSTKKPAKVVPPLSMADGAAQDLPAGFPDIKVAIADDATGTPTVTIPDGAAPTELQIAVLKKGDGKVVPEGADVVVNYQGLIWGTKAIFDDSWARGSASTFNTAGVITGFKEALEGQTVGSQVVVVIPPADGYGETGQPDAGIAGTDTLVFVVDILGIA